MQMENNKVGHFYTQSFQSSLYIHRIKCDLTLFDGFYLFMRVFFNKKLQKLSFSQIGFRNFDFLFVQSSVER